MDIANTEKISKFFENYHPEYIFHLAAHFANQNSVDHPISDVNTNVIGLVNILESQRKNPNLKKVVYTSSSCVYGNIENMIEHGKVAPYDTPYAINKYVGELYCNYYSKIHRVPTICARVFNSYGPGEFPGEYRNVIPNFIRKCILNENINITGSGEETRDFTFVKDTVDLLLKLAFCEYREAEVFNGGTGRKTSIKKLANLIVKLTGSKSQIHFSAPRNWDHVKDRVSNIEKSKRILGYNPITTLEEGLIPTIEWIKTKIL